MARRDEYPHAMNPIKSARKVIKKPKSKEDERETYGELSSVFSSPDARAIRVKSDEREGEGLEGGEEGAELVGNPANGASKE